MQDHLSTQGSVSSSMEPLPVIGEGGQSQGQHNSSTQSTQLETPPLNRVLLVNNGALSLDAVRPYFRSDEFILEEVRPEGSDGNDLGDRVASLFDEAYHGDQTFPAVVLDESHGSILVNEWARVARFPGESDVPISLSKYLNTLYPATSVVTLSDGNPTAVLASLRNGDYAHLVHPADPQQLASVLHQAVSAGRARLDTQKKVMQNMNECFSEAIERVISRVMGLVAIARKNHDEFFVGNASDLFRYALEGVWGGADLLRYVFDNSVGQYRTGRVAFGKPRVLFVGYDQQERVRGLIPRTKPDFYEVVIADGLDKLACLEQYAAIVIRSDHSRRNGSASDHGTAFLLYQLSLLPQERGCQGRVILVADSPAGEDIQALLNAWPMVYDVLDPSTPSSTMDKMIYQAITGRDFEDNVRTMALGSLAHHGNTLLTPMSCYASLIHSHLDRNVFIVDYDVLCKLGIIERSATNLSTMAGSLRRSVHRMEINPYPSSMVYDLGLQDRVSFS